MSILHRTFAAICLLSLPALAGSPVQGISSFHQVDEHVYRGAQPTTEGFEYLAKIGVKTVLDLRENGERATGEALLATALGMHYHSCPN
jgi:tyrosine-protein phosphatase SIW14